MVSNRLPNEVDKSLDIAPNSLSVNLCSSEDFKIKFSIRESLKVKGKQHPMADTNLNS